jgi:acyl dehydratase
MTQPRTFEQVEIGERLTPLTVGPLTPVHLMRFSAAIENWHRIHYDERFAREHDSLPGLLISGSYKQHLAAQMVRSWAGEEGRLTRITLQFRTMNVAGETLTVWGTVTDRREQDGVGVICCAIGIRNDAGLESSPGTATVTLPLAGAPLSASTAAAR